MVDEKKWELPRGAHRLSDGNVVLMTENRGAVLIDSVGLEHIAERHMAGATIEGSRIYGDENLLELVDHVARSTEGKGLVTGEFSEPVGTDTIWSISDIEQTCGMSLKDLVKKGYVRMAGEGEARAGVSSVVIDNLPEDLKKKLVAKPSNKLNVVFGDRPPTPDAFPGADKVIVAWKVARRELGLSEEDINKGSSLITMFPGTATPKLPTDPYLEEHEREESIRFWSEHAFVNQSPPLTQTELKKRELLRNVRRDSHAGQRQGARKQTNKAGEKRRP